MSHLEIIRETLIRDFETEISFLWKVKTNTQNYSKLLNWFSGEFDNYIMDELDGGLEVYFPNGAFVIHRELRDLDNFYAIIHLNSKSKWTLAPLKDKIKTLLLLFKDNICAV